MTTHDEKCLADCQAERELIAQQLADCQQGGGQPPDCSACEAALAAERTENKQLQDALDQANIQIQALNVEVAAKGARIVLLEAQNDNLQTELDECQAASGCDDVIAERDEARRLAEEWRTKSLRILTIADEVTLSFRALVSFTETLEVGAKSKRQKQQVIYYDGSGPNFPWEGA